MDGLIIWKSIIIFLFVFFFLWIIFYTFYPGFLGSDDKANGKNRGCEGADCNLSAKGRTKLFLATIIPAFSLSILYFLFSYYFTKSMTINCSKKAKKLGQCKINR